MLAMLGVLAVRGPAAQAGSVDVKGEVTHVADGDTIDVDIWGDGTRTPARIRFIGIQAMEIHDPGTTSDDDCHAWQAQHYMKSLLHASDQGGTGTTVRLTAQDASSTGRGRLMRRVIRVSDGIDIGLRMIQQQWAFAFPLPIETKYNQTYIKAAEQAAASPISGRIWDNDACGSGPYQGTHLKMWLNYEAKGTDGTNFGEWVKIKNPGSATVWISGWELRDSALNIYHFPSGSSIAPGATLTVYIVDESGHTRTSTKQFWVRSTPLFENTTSAKNFGDGAYLIDTGPTRAGDIRAHFTYPCLWGCVDPAAGKLNLSANFDADGDDNVNINGEWVNISNTSSSDVDLAERYVLVAGHDSTHNAIYPFLSNAVIHPGERMRVYTGKGTSTRLAKYWGFSTSLLRNAAGWVRLRTFDDQLTKARVWPCACSTGPSGLSITSVNYSATDPDIEAVTVTNGSTSTVNLRDYAIWFSPYLFDFPSSTSLAPGKTVTVHVGSVGSSLSNGSYTMSWGHSKQMFSLSGGAVSLLTQYRTVRSCYHWGSGSC